MESNVSRLLHQFDQKCAAGKGQVDPDLAIYTQFGADLLHCKDHFVVN